MLSDTEFHTIADDTLGYCFDQLEESYNEGDIDELELEDGVLTIVTVDARTFILSKHSASKQIWLASPFSGGLHFSFDANNQRWQLANTTPLFDQLRLEFAQAGIEVSL